MTKDSFASEPQTLAVKLNWQKQTCLEYQGQTAVLSTTAPAVQRN